MLSMLSIRDPGVLEADLDSKDAEPQLTASGETASEFSADTAASCVNVLHLEGEKATAGHAFEIHTLHISEIESDDGDNLQEQELSKPPIEMIVPSSSRIMTDGVEYRPDDISGGRPRQHLIEDLQELDRVLPALQATIGDGLDPSGVQPSENAQSESDSSTGSESGEDVRITITCGTENLRASSFTAIRVGFGDGKAPRWTPGSTIPYTMLIDKFPSDEDREHAMRCLEGAASAWNAKNFGVKFQRVEPLEPHVFDLAYGEPGMHDKYLALAFFPGVPNWHRTVYVCERALAIKKYRTYLTGILCHELGHVLGLRHEWPAMDENERSDLGPGLQLGSKKDNGVMNYYLDQPEKWQITDFDVSGIKEFYGQRSGKKYRGYKIVDRDPELRRLRQCVQYRLS